MGTPKYVFFFFFNDTATTEIYTLSLHDALPIYGGYGAIGSHGQAHGIGSHWEVWMRSEEHTSELQSQSNLVCRLLLEKKKKQSTGPRVPKSTSSCGTLEYPARHRLWRAAVALAR